MKSVGILLLLAIGAYCQSCAGRCGDSSISQSCQCNSQCSTRGDCCTDYEGTCLSCQDRCGERYLRNKPCQCNSKCGRYGNCCSDYSPVCRRTGGARNTGSTSSSTVTTAQLRAESEELLRLDSGGAQIPINPQGKASSANLNDMAAGPLIGTVPTSVLNWETTKLMRMLLDNYIPDATKKEVVNSNEQAEEDKFLNALVKTNVMKELDRFLKSKGALPGTLRSKLKEIWFTQYKRAGRNVGSSGFEHVFIGELKGGKVSGFHNWLNFMKEEGEQDQYGNPELDYKGYMRILNLNGKGQIIKMRFAWLDQEKAVGSVFVGTTPELEMALYTLCFVLKPAKSCPIQLANQRLSIQTWTYNARGKTVIGSAYPNI